MISLRSRVPILVAYVSMSSPSSKRKLWIAPVELPDLLICLCSSAAIEPKSQELIAPCAYWIKSKTLAVKDENLVDVRTG